MMRLINTSTLLLHEFSGRNVPLYAILSHRWENSEVTFEDLKGGKGPDRAGWRKITGCCSQAARDGWEYVWIDSCCIDKSSSSELSEAINSMFSWYRSAQICYVYLSDVPSADDDHFAPDSHFRNSKWFQRGWTLQELVAPRRLEFYSQDWVEFGTKSSLGELISVITGITDLFHYQDACIAQKMSWAARRETTREEDQAYCLMGLFDVNMGILYGEGGRKAFNRLQQEIIKKTDDESLFAWNHHHGCGGGLLADSPAFFSESGDVRRASFDATRPCHSMTNKGLRLELILLPQQNPEEETLFLAPLNCTREGSRRNFVALQITKSTSGHYREGVFQTAEWEGKRLNSITTYRGKKPLFGQRTVIFVRSYLAESLELVFVEDGPTKIVVPTLSLLECGFLPSQRSNLTEDCCWKQNDADSPLVRKVVQSGEVAELFFTNEDFGIFALVLGMHGSQIWLDIMKPINQARNLAMAEFPEVCHMMTGSRVDRISRWLLNGLSVSAAVKIAVEGGMQVYKVDVTVSSGGELRWPERRVMESELRPRWKRAKEALDLTSDGRGRQTRPRQIG
ncbi:heterokaryon incompatibility protein-domain-containing protein [Rhexocercosporidium sp. MPI-PUGE-AT-0058]|nr:heterokaryon incompatibility protein-domain-containing protein [Rhexocercosporidium sp. MPI-PUGE-AT-0058]